MTDAQKISKIQKLTNNLVEALDEFDLHYRLVICSRSENANAVESSNFTNLEKVTDATQLIIRILEESGTTKEILFGYIGEVIEAYQADEEVKK